MIFMAIVVAFVICHSPRVGLDLHEIFTLKESNECLKAKTSNTVPYWVFIAGNISHCLLVLNATINAYIYGFMSAKFREEIKRVWKEMMNAWRTTNVEGDVDSEAADV